VVLDSRRRARFNVEQRWNLLAAIAEYGIGS
jgi:hypothetical protein